MGVSFAFYILILMLTIYEISRIADVTCIKGRVVVQWITKEKRWNKDYWAKFKHLPGAIRAMGTTDTEMIETLDKSSAAVSMTIVCFEQKADILWLKRCRSRNSRRRVRWQSGSVRKSRTVEWCLRALSSSQSVVQRMN